MIIHECTGLPVAFDYFSYSQIRGEELLIPVMQSVQKTWIDDDSPMIVNYSHNEPGEMPGTHATTLDADKLKQFLKACSRFNFDLMLHFKGRELSAVRAVSIAAAEQVSFWPKYRFDQSINPSFMSS